MSALDTIAPASIGEGRSQDAGDVRCACGLAYRFARFGDVLRFWPSLGHGSFRPEPLATASCIACHGDLGGAVTRALRQVLKRTQP